MFQQYSLYPHLSVYDNLAFPLRSPLRRVPEARVREKVLEIARLLRIEDKLGNPATRLSGGQMQRVAIGRALVREPAVTLMDEPLSSLDAKLRNDLRLELKRIQQDLGATMLYVTHDQTEALTLATRIGVLDHGQLAQVGSPREIYEDPQTSAVAARLGSPRINLVPRAALGAWPAPEGAATLGVRAEHLHLRNGTPRHRHPRCARTVRRIEMLSDQRLVHLALADGAAELISAAPASGAVEPGSQVQRGAWTDRSGSTPPAGASPPERPADTRLPEPVPMDHAIADPRRDADADRSRRRADRARQRDRRRRPRPEHEARRAGDPGAAAGVAGRRLAQRDAEGRRRHLHEHHRRLVGAGVRHLAGDAGEGAAGRARAARSRRGAGARRSPR